MKKIRILIALLFLGAGFLFLNMKNNEATVVGEPKVGDTAPEITGIDPNGKTITLSSLRGQVVLIDFWASWCPPCRKANKNVVKTYNKYKNKTFINAEGFTVFSVSLDTDKSKWKSAIKIDKLSWDSHINDKQAVGAESSAKRYSVTAIPTTFLIDGEGKIIAKNLHGTALEYELKKLMK